MAGMDRAAIVFSIAITAIGVGIAVYGGSAETVPGVAPTPAADSMRAAEMEREMMEQERMEMEREREMMEMERQMMEQEMMREMMEREMMEKEMMEREMMEKEMAGMGPSRHTVEIPAGTSVPGCEATDECYLPTALTISAGDTVEWINVDTAAHTVTSGAPSDGPSGVFDSSLVMADGIYEFTFDSPGSYDYFCLVHPWMAGTVTVN